MKAKVKYKIIHQCVGKYPIVDMCRFFEVSRSGYYAWLSRKEQRDKDVLLADLIRECRSKRGRIHGYRYVQLWLKRTQGIHRNPKTILRIMQKYDLLSEVRRKRYHHSQIMHRYANLFNRNFRAVSPNSKWVTDISYIPTGQGFLYLSVIRDLYDNSIVAYKTSRQQTVTLVLDTIRCAMNKEEGATELQLHSDQGFQYTSHAYFHLTKEYGITQSISRRGNPYDNALAGPKTSFPFSKLNVLTGKKFRLSSRPNNSLMITFISTILSDFN